MFVRWQNSKTVSKRKQNGKVNRCRAILVESVRVDGKPRQRYIAFLESYDPDFLKRRELPARCYFWQCVSKRLDRLGTRISPDDRQKIEAALAVRVPRPSPEELERNDREEEEGWRRLMEFRSAPNGAARDHLVHYEDGV